MFLLVLKICFSLLLTVFLPGFFWLNIFSLIAKIKLNFIEKAVLIFSLGIISTNFSLLLLNFLKIPLTFLSIFLAIILPCLTIYLILSFKKKSRQNLPAENRPRLTNRLVGFWRKPASKLFFILLLSSILLRGFYAVDALLPKATDLGHHMYWAKLFTVKEKLVPYGQPDFIIGEHLIFTANFILSGISPISPLPVTIIFLINIFSLLAIFILTQRLAENFLSEKKAFLVASLALLAVGVLYPIGDPQAKYISGGVIGNTLGNLFIPLSLWAFVRTLKTKKWPLGFLFILLVATLIYTHHLSTFILLYVLIGFLVFGTLSLLTYHRLHLIKTAKSLWSYVRPFLAYPNLALILALGLCLFFVWTPSYLNRSAIDTAVGTPIKITRTGLSLGQIILSVGPWRFFYGVIGALVLVFIFFKQLLAKKATIRTEVQTELKLVSVALFDAWALMIFLMSTFPGQLKVDIPSARIVNYLSLPFVLLSAVGIFAIFHYARKKLTSFSAFIFTVVLCTGLISGLADLSENARGASDQQAVKATYAAAEWLAPKIKADEQVLKDHIHLPGDTWMKLFFMRDYKFPLSRTYDFRYEDIAKNRETCTRDMVAIPDSQVGQACFNQTRVKYVVLRAGFDTDQFEKSKNFKEIYNQSGVVIFERK